MLNKSSVMKEWDEIRLVHKPGDVITDPSYRTFAEAIVRARGVDLDVYSELTLAARGSGTSLRACKPGTREHIDVSVGTVTGNASTFRRVVELIGDVDGKRLVEKHKPESKTRPRKSVWAPRKRKIFTEEHFEQLEDAMDQRSKLRELDGRLKRVRVTLAETARVIPHKGVREACQAAINAIERYLELARSLDRLSDMEMKRPVETPAPQATEPSREVLGAPRKASIKFKGGKFTWYCPECTATGFSDDISVASDDARQHARSHGEGVRER